MDNLNLYDKEHAIKRIEYVENFDLTPLGKKRLK